MEHLGKVSVLLGVLKGDEVHTPLATEVPGVEPVPVLELVPGLAPGEEVVVAAVLLVVLPTTHKLVPDRPKAQCRLHLSLHMSGRGLLSSGRPSGPTLGLS